MSLIADPRVEHGVEEVNDKVGQDVDEDEHVVDNTTVGASPSRMPARACRRRR